MSNHILSIYHISIMAFSGFALIYVYVTEWTLKIIFGDKSGETISE